MKKNTRIRRKKPVVEEIEPRILYSADFSPAVLDPHTVLPQAEQRVLNAGGEFAAGTAQLQVSAPQSVRHEVVFVDAAVPDYQKLVDDITANSDAQHQYDVVLLNPGADGIKQITRTLTGMHDVSAVHIISHGTDGQVQLGDTTLNFDSLLKNASQIKGWGQALTPDADVLIYGCNVAEHADGKALVDALSRLTGADVAASDDVTGAAAQGGNWSLEYQDGHIETAVAVSLSEQLDWKGTLQTVAQGTETKANTSTTGTQQTNVQGRPVAIDANGNYVVVWQGNGTQPGQSDADGVFFQRYNAAGVAQGAETRVNTTTTGNQTNPTVAIDANGNFVVAWSGNGTQAGQSDADGVFFQRYNASGVAQGGETRVNTTTAGTQDAPLIAMNESGTFVIAWDSNGQDGSGQGVYAQRFNAAGAKQGGEFRVNTTTAGDQYADSIAMDGAGNFIVAFSSSDGNGKGVYTQRYNAGGGAIGGEVQVNTTTAGDQTWSTVAMNRSGAYVVAWASVGQDGSGSGIYAQRFDANGVAQGSEFRVNGTTAGDQVQPIVAMDASGNFTVVWSSFGQDVAGTWGVYKQDYNADGTTFGGETRVNTTTSGDQQHIGVAMNAVGQYVTVWDGNGPGDASGVFFQRFTSGLVVDTTSDAADGTTTSIANLLAARGADGKISLREAILATNSSGNVGGPDRIYFNIAGAGVHTINVLDPDGGGPLAGLPNITDAVVIDGTSQRGFAGTPLIELNGTSAGAGANGLTLVAGSSGSTIEGLVINRFVVDGIRINGSSNNTIAGNFVGTNAAGSSITGMGNLVGVDLISGSTNNTIGGTTTGARNVISGNTVDGIQIRNAGTMNNVVAGNYIGLDVTGTVDLGNTNQGIAIFAGATSNTVGGTAAGTRNVISGNNGEGVRMTGAGTSNNLVVGNYIGLNAAGTGAVGNGNDGVTVQGGATNNTVGGITAAERNVISGNLDDGIEIKDAGTTGNTVLGNWIGLNPGGTAAIANADDGVVFSNGSTANTLGGLTASSANVISGNTDAGVFFTDSGTSGNLVEGNIIGLNPGATAAIANGGDGVKLQNAASGNNIGSSASGAGNVIAGNAGSGVRLLDNSDSNTIRGNWIGTNSGGVLNLGNAQYGVYVQGGATAASSPTTISVGGVLSGEGNVIAFSALDGVAVSGAGSSGIAISGNSIYSNTRLGINLIGGSEGASGVTANDAAGGWTGTDRDPDSGPNALQNYPSLSGAVWDGTTLYVSGSLNSTGSSNYRIHVYASSAVDPSGNGEGQRYLGSFNVATPANGNVLFTSQAVTPLALVSAGDWITVTATALSGPDRNTSEFSTAVQAVNVNSAPVLSGANNLASINEDAAGNAGTLVSSLISGKVSDPDAGALAGIAVTAVVNTNGTWQYSTNAGGSWTSFGSPSNSSALLLAADANTYVRFVPNANWNGAVTNGITFRAWDQTSGTAGSTADTSSNGGSTAFSSATASASVTVSSVNDAPAGTNNTVTTNEDSAYTFAGADFGFSDAADSPANNLTAVRISTIPAAGSLTLSGVAVTAGQSVSVANITAGNLKFTPAANASGAGYASFTFQVQDDGGTANGGVDLDASPNTMTVNVTAVNDAPAGTNNTVTTNEDSAYTFAGADFGFSDAADSPANNLTAVRISTIPAAGSLTLSGVAVTAGQSVSVANITAGNLKFTPAANASGAGYASFTFQVQDDGGTANGGVDLDASPNTMTVNVTAVNDAPAGTNNTVTTNEDSAYTFAGADFGFSDAADSPANNLTAVRISTIPAAGSLTLSGVAVTAGQSVSVANITAGNLKFTPAANASGAGYASFTFQVQDDGGTANGGVDLDASPNTMTVNVTAVNDAPAGTNNTVTTNEDSAYTFAGADFGFSDAADSPANNLTTVRISTIPAAGSLTLSGVAVTAGQSVSVANITAGNLKFTPAANASGAGYASFTFQVQDDGGTANGGVDLDASPNTMTVNVTAVNDAPINTVPASQGTSQDTSLVFSSGNGNQISIADVDAGASPVRVTLAAANGTITLNGVGGLSFSTGDGAADLTMTFTGTIANINAALNGLAFDPTSGYSGAASVSITTNDQGNSGSGGPQSSNNTVNITVSPTANPVASNDTYSVNEDSTLVVAPSATNLVDWWKLDDGGASQTAADAVLPASNGTLGSTAGVDANDPVWTSGRVGTGALAFDGSDDYVSTSSTTAKTAASFTISVWFQTDVTTGQHHILWEGYSGGNGYGDPTSPGPATSEMTLSVGTYNQDNKIAFFLGYDVPANGGDPIYIVSSRNFMDTTNWHHVAVSVSDLGGGVLSGSLYVDGVLEGTDTGVENDRSQWGNLQVGAPDGATRFFDGDLDDIRVYNAALSQPQIQSLARAGVLENDTDAKQSGLTAILVSGPANGSLSLSGDGSFVYTPNANFAGTDSFTYLANDGQDDSNIATATITVNPVNDAPAGVNKTVTTQEDNAYTFAASDFGFTDPSDSPANALLNVKITTLPGAGTLTDNGVAVTAGQFVTAADISGGKLVFTPAADATGAGYTSFNFQVQDDGGTANGGVDLDPVANTMTIDVTAVNDAPAGANKTVTTPEDNAYIFAAGDFGFTDPSDTPANALLNVRITTLPSAGTLTDNGVAVTAGHFVTAADISGGLLAFTPAADANGAGYASFTFQVQDNGGTVNGGVDLDLMPNTITIDVTAINDAPVLSGASNLSAINEDPAVNPGTLVSALISGQTTDIDPAALTGIAVTAVDNTNGAWQYSINGGTTWNAFGVPTTANARLLAADASTYVRFVPNANWNGSVAAGITFRAWDQSSGAAGASANTTVNGGSTAFSNATASSSITVNPVNDAPAGLNKTVTTNEDTAYSFTVADFGFIDAADAPGNSLLNVKITTLPGAGTLTDNGVALTAGQSVTLADIAAGNLTFTPAVDANGAGYTSFTFQVQDDGGTANGGVDLDPTPRTMTVDVTPVNDAPTAASGTVTTAEDTPYVFSVGDFNFSDVDAGDTLQSVTVVSVSGGGSLTLSGAPVGVGQVISAANIGNLVFTPAPATSGAGYASFGFTVSDGTASSSPVNVLTVDVGALNDAPQGSSNTVTTLEDSAYTFATADFGFGDPNDSPANNLQAVEITTLPTFGTLTDNGVAVSAGQLVSVVDIAGGKLVFAPAANANGNNYATFTFQVQDDGGTAGGGADIDPTPRTMTIDVTPVNDAPQGASNALIILEDNVYTFGAVDFGFSDPNDVPVDALAAVQITTLPGAGSLTDNGAAVAAGQFVSVADITGGLVTFTPMANANGAAYTSFTFQVQDNGGIANGGVNTDLTPRTMTIDVTAVNDAPVLSSNTLIIASGGSVILSGANLSASDVDNPAAGLMFTVSNVLDGQFELVATPGVAVTSFTQGAIAGGQVRFVHNGSTNAPAFDVTVTDGTSPVGPTAATIVFSVPASGGPVIAPPAPPPPSPGSNAGGTPPAAPPPASQTKLAQPSVSHVVPVSGGLPMVPEAVGIEMSDLQGTSQFLRVEAKMPRSNLNPAPLLKPAEQTLLIAGTDPQFMEFGPLTKVDWSAQSAFPSADRNPSEHDQIQVIMESVRMGGIALSVGVVWWASRVTGLIGSLLASMPAWRQLDPLPIVGRDEEEDRWDETGDSEADADELAISMVLEGPRSRDAVSA